jgi:N-acetylmuramoyl-L-alanine amidase
LQGVRSWSDTEKLRLVLDVSRTATYRVSRAENSPEIRVFLPDVLPSPSLTREIVFQDSLVRAVRVGEKSNGLEVVIELAKPQSLSPFELAATSDQPYRIIFDVPRGPGQGAAVSPQRTPAPAPRPILGTPGRIVVIDAGHGGDQPGAIGHRRTVEKLVTFTISTKIAERLERQPGVRVLLTRYGDYDVPLRERYRMADSCRADAFVSIHANSSRRRNQRGSEVFFLSLTSASDEQDAFLADIENAAGAVEANAEEEEVTGILVDLKQQEVLRHSQMLAEAILDQITEDRRLSARGVKQAPFAVLKSPITPSVLVETAFINHPEEAKLLRDPKFQDRMADQIVRGVLQYLETAPAVARTGAAESYFEKALAKRNGS